MEEKVTSSVGKEDKKDVTRMSAYDKRNKKEARAIFRSLAVNL